jgi:hypothetical protein
VADARLTVTVPGPALSLPLPLPLARAQSLRMKQPPRHGSDFIEALEGLFSAARVNGAG